MSLKHGMSGKLLIEGSKGNHISVPRSATETPRQSGNVGMVSKEHRSRKAVTYGFSSNENVPIYDGLSLNDEIVVSGHTRLKDGETVLAHLGVSNDLYSHHDSETGTGLRHIFDHITRPSSYTRLPIGHAPRYGSTIRCNGCDRLSRGFCF